MSEITYTKHGDKRVNNPTIENRGFVVQEEIAPYKALYPRDPSLDPQLVWKGKDEQDREDLSVDTVPIYRQEHIHPRVMIEDIKARSAARTSDSDEGLLQPSLYPEDFNGIEGDDVMSKFDKEVDFYSHAPDRQKHWTNRMILGDSLLVMNSLAEKEGLKGKVQCIYIDPPYGIKFGSNWQVSTKRAKTGDKAADAAREPEVIRAFRDTWKLGIHSYLSYLRDRLVLSQQLLTDTGSVFVQISDENVHLVRCLMDEVFGSENFVSVVSYSTTGGFETDFLSRLGDYILWYAKDKKQLKYRQQYLPKSKANLKSGDYRYILLQDGSSRLMTAEERSGEEDLPEGARIFRLDNMISQGGNDPQPFQINGRTYTPGDDRHWKASYPKGLQGLLTAGRIHARENSLAYIRMLDDLSQVELSGVWTDTSIAGRRGGKIYVVQTNELVVQRCILMATDPGDLVLDPTCGSGTTAYVAEQWGRRWITVDTSRVALALARTRLMCARFPYYHLADSQEGVKKEAELTGITPPPSPLPAGAERGSYGDIKKGFVYKRVPHVTLKSIANNPDIEAIAAEFDAKLEASLAYINGPNCFGTNDGPGTRTHETVPKPEDVGKQGEIVAARQANCVAAVRQYWELKQARREAIDKAIAKHADTEFLYDQPYEDNKRVRVTGPFTVESLSPHRVIPVDDEGQPLSESEAKRDDATNDFVTMVIENLKKSGVQNTKKGERLRFESLEPFAGKWVHAVGTFGAYGASGMEDGAGEPAKVERRVAISIGPEYGAVSPMQVKEAAKEAVQGIGHDVLIVCGYAFDPHVNEEAKQIGQLTILPTRMNADLLMGDDLLKKTGSGNLFMVFGEPDLEVLHLHVDGGPGSSPLGRCLQVELKGLDVYDPTTGEIRSNSTGDIACWFIDTNYNGESFFVRHAYFVGAEVTDKKDGQKYDPYRALRSTLRAEIDADAWASIYSTVSRPFQVPETGKFAVKVINHYGDEVLKVYTV